MPAADHQCVLKPLNSFSKSIMSMRRRDQVYSMEGSDNEEIELFQKFVTERFIEISSTESDEILSLTWIRKLLDTFLNCLTEFRMLLCDDKFELNKSPADRFLVDFCDRVVKALDVCNAIRDGVEKIKQWRNLLEIVLIALDCENKSITEGPLRRAKKALIDLGISMFDQKDCSSSGSSNKSSFANRSRSFGNNFHTGERSNHSTSYSRSLSWSVSRTWSAAKQLQAMGSNLIAPRGGEIVASNGLVIATYTMSSVLLFVMWTLVAAIPCQDRGLQVQFSIPRHFTWANPILTLHEFILEESRKRERKNACGLLKEIHQMEKCKRHLSELIDSVQFPLTAERECEVRNGVAELARVCRGLNSGLESLEFQVREVFHKIVRSRTEGLASIGRP